MAVFLHYDGTQYNLWANRFILGTGWGSAVLLESAPNNAWGVVGVDPAGNAIPRNKEVVNIAAGT